MGHMWLVRNMHRCDDEADNPGWNLSHVRTYLLKQQVIPKEGNVLRVNTILCQQLDRNLKAR